MSQSPSSLPLVACREAASGSGMRELGTVLAALAAGTGLIAAWYWYRSGKISISIGWRPKVVFRGPVDPAEEQQELMEWTVATIDAFSVAGRLNRTAALWTAASVILSAATAVVSSLAS